MQIISSELTMYQRNQNIVGIAYLNFETNWRGFELIDIE